jgi:beta-galactosidase
MHKLRFILLIVFSAFISTNGTAQLENIAQSKIKTLNALIKQSEKKGIDVTKEKMTVRTAEVFLEYANWDEKNVEENIDYFNKTRAFKEQAQKYAKELPNYERQEVIVMLEEAINNIKLVNSGTIIRKPVPKIDWSNLTIQGNQIINNGKPVFLSDYTWKPHTKALTEYFGNLDGVFFTPSYVTNEKGAMKLNILNAIKNKPDGNFGTVFLNHKGVPKWAKETYPDIEIGKRLYTEYDIDNPGARFIQSSILSKAAPYMADKKYSELGYLLTNEPHWNTVADTWATGTVSKYTKEKFKTWLSKKHAAIKDLNALWNSDFISFENITIEIPMQGNLRGTPIWYDWMAFNMDRVTEWFTFLQDEIHKHDPNANTHIKVMPNLWSENKVDHGLDFEALVNLTTVIGNDAGSHNSLMWGKKEDWEDHYSFSWREMCMSYDFFKSVAPNKINYNSEVHYLSTVRFRDLYLKPSYARSVYWLAHLQGMNAGQTWFWPRLEDGSIKKGAGNGYAGSNNQQPRIINEVASTMMDLNANSEDITALQNLEKPLRVFYSKTSAINKTGHMDDQFNLYKSLYFEGTPLGFATQGIIESQDNNLWEAILVYENEFVTDLEFNSLQTYLNNGGTVIIDEISLTKNEYGLNRNEVLNNGKGRLIAASSLEDMSKKALNLVKASNKFPEISLKEINDLNIKGCVWKAYTDKKGRHVITIVNIGKSEATITLGLKDKASVACTNLLNGQQSGAAFKMAPEDVLLLEVK